MRQHERKFHSFGDALRAVIGEHLDTPLGVIASALETEAHVARQKQIEIEARQYTALAPGRTPRSRPARKYE